MKEYKKTKLYKDLISIPNDIKADFVGVKPSAVFWNGMYVLISLLTLIWTPYILFVSQIILFIIGIYLVMNDKIGNYKHNTPLKYCDHLWVYFSLFGLFCMVLIFGVLTIMAISLFFGNIIWEINFPHLRNFNKWLDRYGK